MTEKRAVMAFGRMNPPTTGHEKLMHAVHKEAKRQGASAHIIASHSHDSEKNPIHPSKKLGYLKKVAPKGVNVSVSSKEHPNILHHVSRLHAAGHDHLTVVAAGDREKEFHSLLHRYNGKKGPHGHYNFKSIKIHSAGKRDPDAEGTEGISGTKMRAHAKAGDHKSFQAGLPKSLHKHTKEIMKHVKEERVENEAFEQFLNERVQKNPLAKEQAHLKHINKEFDRVKKETGKDHVVINHNGKTHHITHVENVPGTPKADFKAHDKNGNHIYISHKDYDKKKGGDLTKHYQQLGGASKHIDHPLVKKLAKHIKDNHGGSMTGSGHGTLHVKLDHKNPEHQKIIKKAIFGDKHGDRGEKHGVNNIHSIIQGKMNLKKRSDGKHEITADHIHHHNEPVKHHGMIYATSDKKRNDGKKHGLSKTRLRIGWHGSRKSTKVSESVISEGPYLSGPTVTPSARKDAPFTGTIRSKKDIKEKILTAAEKRKREKVALAIKRDNPNMPIDKKMAIATSVAKKVAEAYNTPAAEHKKDKKYPRFAALTDLDLNTKNRNLTIDEYSYGPANPDNEEDSKMFWENKADLWNCNVDQVKSMRCGNCSAFNQTPEVKKKMVEALGPEGETIVEKANLGYCEFFEFKCAGARTCDAWVGGGPITEETDMGSDIDEALTYKQRVQRKMIMRRHRPKMIMRKRMLARKKAPEKNIAQRARKAAIRAIRKRVAGKKGQQYHKLTPQEKIMVDQRVAKKQAIVNRIAKRMLPVMRKAELVRLKSRQTKVNEVFAEYMDLMETPTPVSGNLARKHNPTLASSTKDKYTTKTSKSNIKKNKAVPTVEETVFKFVDSIMCNDYVLSEKEVKKLTEKAVEHNVPYSILKEVYDQGIQEWDESGKHTPQQVAWNKLNVFLARPDLVEYVLDWGTPEATAFWKKATPGEGGDGYRPQEDVQQVDEILPMVGMYLGKKALKMAVKPLIKLGAKAAVGGAAMAAGKHAYDSATGRNKKKEDDQFENYQSMGSGATTNAGQSAAKVIQPRTAKQNAAAKRIKDALAKKNENDMDRYSHHHQKEEVVDEADSPYNKAGATKGYFDHMKKVNKGQAYKYPGKGKGKGLSQAAKDKFFGKKKVQENAPVDHNTDMQSAAEKKDAKGKKVGNIKVHMNPPMTQVKEGIVGGAVGGAIGSAIGGATGGIGGAVSGAQVGSSIGSFAGDHAGKIAAGAAGAYVANKIRKKVQQRRRDKALDRMVKDHNATHKANKERKMDEMAAPLPTKKQSDTMAKIKQRIVTKKIKRSVNEEEGHHATVEYEKGHFGAMEKKKVKIPLKKVDTAKGFSRTPESTQKEVHAHDIHKQHKADGWRIKQVSYKNKPKHYSKGGGQPFARYEEKDPS